MTGRSRSGRSGTGNARYRRNRAILLSQNTLCWLCGHEGSMTADHVIRPAEWARIYPHDPYGCDELGNLRPAHGTLSPGRLNRCPDCGKLCNQSRGARMSTIERRPQSRDWLGG